jgi:hypothetical protein
VLEAFRQSHNMRVQVMVFGVGPSNFLCFHGSQARADCWFNSEGSHTGSSVFRGRACADRYRKTRLSRSLGLQASSHLLIRHFSKLISLIEKMNHKVHKARKVNSKNLLCDLCGSASIHGPINLFCRQG